MKKTILVEEEIEVCNKCEQQIYGIQDHFDMDNDEVLCLKCFKGEVEQQKGERIEG